MTVLRYIFLALPFVIAFNGNAVGQVLPPNKVAKVAVVTTGPNGGQSDYERIAHYLRTGAHTAGAQTFEFKLDCNSDSARRAAADLISSKPDVVVGYFCKNALWAVLPALKTAGIPTIDLDFMIESPGSETPPTRDFLYSAFEKPIRPDVIAAAFIHERWKGTKFAIISNSKDNSLKNIEYIKEGLANLGIQPALAKKIDFNRDEIASIVNVLMQNDVKNIFISSEPDGIVAFNDAAHAAGYNPGLAGGFEALLYLKRQKLPDGFTGVFQRIANSHKTTPISLAVAFASDLGPTAAAAGYVSGLAAVKSRSEGRSANDILSTETFQTNLGPFYFDKDHFRGDEKLYHVYKWSDGAFILSEE